MTGLLPPALPDSEQQSGTDLAEALRGVRIVSLHGCVPRNRPRASRHHAVEKPVWRAAKRTGALEAQSVTMNQTIFTSLAQARSVLGAWRHDYNHHWPHSSLGNMTPA
jgi:hypothetical protein